jgi:carbon monoxide dehydrogenase subunit G
MSEPGPNIDPWSGTPRAARPPLVSFPLKVLWSAIALLVLGLGIGVAMGGRWEVERSASVAAPPASVFALLDDPRRWDDWAPLAGVESTFSGPERGAGATRRWDNPDVGDGVFTIVSTEPDREVGYRVEVQKGRMITEGTFRLEPEGAGTRVVWRERGDFGRNPLLGYVARNMDRTQGAQMEASLGRLGERARSP